MGVVIFLLICLVIVLIGFLIKYKNENNTENTTEVKVEEVKELSVDNGAVIIDSNKPFPNINYITSDKYTKQYIQSILDLVLDVQSKPTNYYCSFNFDRTNVCIQDWTLYSKSVDIPTVVLTLLKSKNLISIQQAYTPTKYDNYGFIESKLIYKIIIKVTEEGKAYLNS
jgi:hypothetical protein